MKIGIICSLDEFANQVRPLEIKKFLENRNHKVVLINTHPISKNPSKLINLIRIAYRHLPFFLKQYIILLQFRLRPRDLLNKIKKEKFDIVICENLSDSYIFTKDITCLKILDCASPWIDELYYSGKLSKHIYYKLRKMELKVYKKTDYISFHWENYKKYVQKNIYNGNNFFILNWGCKPKPKDKLANFSENPKIIFIGYLGGYWNNLPLLSKLSKLYPVDVYGGPKPNRKWGLNYKGYAPSLDILSKYQFGLITITKDKLRKSSFSSKHLEYLSYGLPVLTPDWRKDALLEDVSIYYDENNFLEKIKWFSNKKKWEEMSKKCYDKAKKWRWDNVLKPLDNIINKNKIHSNEKN